MARITVEDCLEKISNRFDLVLVAARRAHMLKKGAPELLEQGDDRHTVLALREIADGLVTADILDQPIVEPDADVEMPDVEAMHREAAEKIVEEPPAEANGDEFDDKYAFTDADGNPIEEPEKPKTEAAADEEAGKEEEGA